MSNSPEGQAPVVIPARNRGPSNIGTAVLISLVVLTALGGLAWLGKNLLSGMSGPKIVVVDVSRIVNAERALLNKDFEANRLTVIRAGKLAEQVIREIAGEGTLILVKQSVVAFDTSGLPDITEQVLEELALPLDIPEAAKQVPLLSEHSYTEQGRMLIEAESSKEMERQIEDRELEEVRQKKNSLMP